MKKYITFSEKPNLIKEYIIENNTISIKYNDGSNEKIPFSIESINFLDSLIFNQYEEFENEVTVLLNNNELAISVGAGALVSAAFLSTGIGDDNALLMALVAGLGATAVLETFYRVSNAEEISNDYRKDQVLIENYDKFEELIVNDESYDKLPIHVKKELKYVHDGLIPLSINSVRNLNMREISKMLWLSENKETSKKRVRE